MIASSTAAKENRPGFPDKTINFGKIKVPLEEGRGIAISGAFRPVPSKRLISQISRTREELIYN